MKINNIRLILSGTTDTSKKILEYLLLKGYNVVGIITKPDHRKGRGRHISFSSVKELGLKRKIPVFQPKYLEKNIKLIKQIKSLKSDLMVVVSYGLIIPEEIFSIPYRGSINIHFSLLPRWRGAAPIQRAIENGDEVTGITIIRLSIGLDSGNIIKKIPLKIEDNDNSYLLEKRLISISQPALISVIKDIEKNNQLEIEQDERFATYANKILKEEMLINFNSRAHIIEKKIRAFYPKYSTRFVLGENIVKVSESEVLQKITSKKPGEILSITNLGLDISTQDFILRLTKIQFPGKRMLKIEEILKGNKGILKYVKRSL